MINILLHVVMNIRIGYCTSIAHHATNIVSADEFESTCSGRPLGANRESIGDAKMRSLFQNGNAAGNGANECGAKTLKFMYREVGNTLVVPKADVYFCGVTLQAR
jgi:hypothetical protein